SRLIGNTLTGGNGTLANRSVSVPGDIGGEALGGGGFVAETSATITDSILSNNTVIGGNGTYVAGTVKGSVGGSASGGGVYVSTSSSGTFTIAIGDSTLSGNSVQGGSGSGGSATPGFASGGGVYVSDAGKATVTLVNSTIASNVAFGGPATSTTPVAAGGGLFFGSTTTATLTNVTVWGNLAEAVVGPNGQGTTSGGGIDNSGGTVTLVNTLMASNGADTGPDFSGAVTNSDHNLLDVADGSSGFSAAHGDLIPAPGNVLNPQLGPLANNGGPTQTVALLTGSPAINAGDNSAESVAGPFDQRGQGFARVVDNTIDIGAYEVQPPPSPPSPPPSPPPRPFPLPTLHVPPLLGFLDALLGGVETINGNDTETVTDRFFGITLFVSTYDSAGDLTSVTFFGFNVTLLFEMV
ncbi:MAG: choice-of-anchor Q domain-containing protein, partial [Gemmataceae bacterium]